MTTTSTMELYELQAQAPSTMRLPIKETAPEAPTHSHTTHNTIEESIPPPKSNLKTFLIVLQLCMINFLASFTNGIITVGLPTIAKSIDLPRQLYLWPASVYGLTSGAMLLIAGSIADLIGPRVVEVTGCTLLGIFTLSCGFSSTGIQLVVFRALQGVAMSMHLPSSVALVAAAVPQGKSRNVAFGCLGLSQPLGFSFGLVISGIMIERAGWRSGFYLSGAAILLATVAGLWALPKTTPPAAVGEDTTSGSLIHRLRTGIDWLGGIIASAGLALLSYVLAILSADLSSIHHASTAIMLTLKPSPPPVLPPLDAPPPDPQPPRPNPQQPMEEAPLHLHMHHGRTLLRRHELHGTLLQPVLPGDPGGEHADYIPSTLAEPADRLRTEPQRRVLRG